MEEAAIISYPSARDNSLLALTGSRSQYMLPFAGKYRVVDFTIANAFRLGARCILFNNYDDDLAQYAANYGPFEQKSLRLRVVSHEYTNIQRCYSLIKETNAAYYVIYKGDNPSIIDFDALIEQYKKGKQDTVLYQIECGQKASMAHTILVTKQKSLLTVIKAAQHEQRTSPNLFEMIINLLINRGVATRKVKADYWPIKNIPDYYNIHYAILKDNALFERIYTSSVKSYLSAQKLCVIGKHACIADSFISDDCFVNGTVSGCIIYPGVEIDEKAVIHNSIILPYATIGAHARIEKTIIDEYTAHNTPPRVFNIGSRCHVGSETEQLKSSDFPKSIFSSITLIGKNCAIPDGAHIGGACFVDSETKGGAFEKSKVLHDGLSIVGE